MTPAAKDRGAGPEIALVAVSIGGIALAKQLKAALGSARVHALRSRAPADAGLDHVFDDMGEHLRALFARGTPIVAICAAGIVVRALASELSDKRREPPVVAVADDGSAVVPLLGGHRGANLLAKQIAAVSGGFAAVTTGSELRLGFALDEPPAGWRVANPDAAKRFASALIAGKPVALLLEAGDGGWLSESGLGFGADLPSPERSPGFAQAGAPLAIRVSARAAEAADNELLLRPPVLAVGVGCERGVTAEEIVALVREALGKADLSADAVACVASIALKADEPALHALAEDLAVPARFFSAGELEAETPRLANPSDLVFRQTGCHGVAEAAALAAAGPDSTLLLPKIKSRRATVAIARSPAPIEAFRVGRGRGSLAVIGIGPGDAGSLTPEARDALHAAGHVVGYRLYLDLAGDAVAGAARHDFALGEEETRCRKALDLAAAGQRVALVSSGDAGIYALAALVVELMDREDRAEWNRIALSFVPGVSALQAAAARAGAPLGHDFCAISLSDLLTPWDQIARRLEAAAQGDFVVALFNPASRERRHQIVAARDILLSRRAGETPVVVARNLGRTGESVRVIALRDLAPEGIDMATLVLVGSSRTRAVTRGGRVLVYTPRGYDVKALPAKSRKRR